jgi:hypothetical protein
MRNGSARLTDDTVRAIRALYAQGACSQSDLASAHGVCQQLISDIVRRKTWTHI